MKRSEALKRAQDKLNAKTDNITVRVPKGEREIFRQYADSQGMTLTEFVRAACYHEAGLDLPE